MTGSLTLGDPINTVTYLNKTSCPQLRDLSWINFDPFTNNQYNFMFMHSYQEARGDPPFSPPLSRQSVDLMTDDVLAQCDWSRVILKLGTLEINAFIAIPAGRNQCQCNVSSKKNSLISPSSLTNGGSALERHCGRRRRGRERQSLFYLDLYKIKGRANKFTAVLWSAATRVSEILSLLLFSSSITSFSQ